MDWRSDVIGDLRTNVCGQGPPILLIHGFGASSFTWSKVAERLASEHTVITVDLKGFGRSRKPRDGGYTLRDQAAAVLKVIETLDLNDLTVVGHSMGGGVALLVTISLEQQKPGRLSRSHPHRQRGAAAARLPLFLRLLRLPISARSWSGWSRPKWSTRYVLAVAYYDRSKIEQAFVDEYAAPLRCASGRAALVATARAIIPPDADRLVAQYRTIRTPTLLLWGAEDGVVPFDLAGRLNEMIPSSRLRQLDKCGHIPQEEWPDITLSMVQEFIRDSRFGNATTGPCTRPLNPGETGIRRQRKPRIVAAVALAAALQERPGRFRARPAARPSRYSV